jgi:hypothetical protein
VKIIFSDHKDHQISIYITAARRFTPARRQEACVFCGNILPQGDQSMKFSSLLLASVFALSTMANAEDAAPEYGTLVDDDVSDIRVECIEEGIASDLDDSQMSAYVEQCVNDKVAARKKKTDSQG